MGWASAGSIFGPVCETLQKLSMAPEARQKVLVILIKALQDGDWDTEDESAEEFRNDPVVAAAFRERGVYLWGTPEYDIAYGENSVSQVMMRDGEEIDFGGREIEHSDFYERGD